MRASGPYLMLPALRLGKMLVAVLLVAAQAPAPPKTIDLDAATIADMDPAFDAGTLSAVQMSLARIQAYDRRWSGRP